VSTIEQAIQSRQDTVPAPAREFDREQWKAQKQQELEETFQQLNDETMQLLNNPTKYKAFLNLQAKLPALSVGNTLLILNQKRPILLRSLLPSKTGRSRVARSNAVKPVVGSWYR